jgi:hypothetical protein
MRCKYFISIVCKTLSWFNLFLCCNSADLMEKQTYEIMKWQVWKNVYDSEDWRFFLFSCNVRKMLDIICLFYPTKCNYWVQCIVAFPTVVPIEESYLNMTFFMHCFSLTLCTLPFYVILKTEIDILGGLGLSVFVLMIFSPGNDCLHCKSCLCLMKFCVKTWIPL